ncbi:MAG: FAD-binding oxidoreductase [Gemmatimonadota bacterium]
MTDVRGTNGAREVDAAGRADWQRAVITTLTAITPTVVSVQLRPELWRPFLAGQHVDVRLTADDGYSAQRSYSVASAPDMGDTIELVIERLSEGEVSSYFHDEASPGDVVELRGPFAEHFVWRPSEPGPLLLAAGGSGVAPFLSMVRQRARLAAPPRMLLFYSARSWDEVIAREELLRQEQEQQGLSLYLSVTREAAPRRPGDFARRVDRAIIDTLLARLGAPPALSYVCGANRFVGTVADLLIDAGVAAGTIRTERYGGT